MPPAPLGGFRVVELHIECINGISVATSPRHVGDTITIQLYCARPAISLHPSSSGGTRHRSGIFDPVHWLLQISEGSRNGNAHKHDRH